MTTPPVDDPETLRRILSQAEALFLDFDGPVCNVFAGLPASAVVDQLCVVLADGGYGDPPPDIEKSSDPFEVLRYAASLGDTEAAYVNAAFAALEAEAIASAEPTSGARELMRSWSQLGRPMAIVSNNSVQAIEAYLNLHNLEPYVFYVSGRSSADPSLLKPSSYLLNEAIASVGVETGTVGFVGDSLTDVDAAHVVGIASIAYANKPGKVQLFTGAAPTVIVTSIATIIEAIIGSQ
jgi:HAD superfamily hydrolase (TIGR01549 family)